MRLKVVIISDYSDELAILRKKIKNTLLNIQNLVTMSNTSLYRPNTNAKHPLLKWNY